MSDPLVKSKTFSIRSIMNSPLKELLFEAIDAPSGSTKKAKAKAILKSFQAGHQNYLNKLMMDGQGGPGIAGIGVGGDLPLARYAPAGYANKPFSLSTAGSLASSAPATPSATSATPLTLPSTPTRTLTAAPTAAPFALGPTGLLTPSIPGAEPSKPISRVSIMPPTPSTGQVTVMPPTPSTGQVTVMPQEKTTAITKPSPVLMIGTTAIPLTGTPTTVDSSKINEDNGYDILEKYEAAYGTPELDALYKSLNPSEQTRLKPLFEAVKNRETAAAFSLRMMGNKNLMATLLNLPQEVVSKFPESGLLSDQINDLQDTVKNEFQLDTQLKNLVNLQNQNLTIEPDLQAYIRGKDEYLGKIDKMLDDFDYKTAYMDTSDPNVSARLNNYRNYLTILQGRQNQRYINFLDTATKYQTAKLEQATNLYNLSYNQAKEQFEKQERVTTETYNNIKGMLEGMYTNLEGATEASRKSEMYGYEKMKAMYDSLQTMVDYNNTINTSYGAVKERLEASRGDDFGSAINPDSIPGQGYVDSDVYKTEREKAKDKTAFDKNFSWMLNPKDATAQGFIKEDSLAKWEKESAVRTWLATPGDEGGADLSEEEKAAFIVREGLEPETFDLYGFPSGSFGVTWGKGI